jgi:hypothetical protein
MRAKILWIYLLSAVALGQSAPPQTMTKIVVRFESPDVPPTSFAALPKTMYRAGTRYCRIEELPDTEHDIHGLIIISEPDIWLVNRLNKTIKHQVDPGPTFNCHLPIFVDSYDPKSASDKNNPLIGLEFGREFAYFMEKRAISTPGPTLQGKSTKAYIIEIGQSELLLFTSGTPERPVALARESGTKREVYWYGSYDEIPFDVTLFAKQEGLKIEEVK